LITGGRTVSYTTKICLIGTAKVVRRDGRMVVLPRKAAALLAYLALQGRAARSALAELLWPAALEPAARANLRDLLCRLHDKVGERCVIGGNGDSLRLDPSTWVDVLHDPDGVDGHLLLAAYAYDDCRALDAWLRSEREGLRAAQTNRLLEELGRCFGAVG